ncbi:MAG: hypothetical protein B1H08_05570 [Candidatus Omnitrophica bacterium 4484_171]|nr:MAG: hypothetical protein B1H08_05570 [Candidatus Omnitrophica bacterium 4484_171]
MERTWRIIADEPKDAYYNMAKDEALLFSYKKSRIPVFRIYSWDSPSVSIGYRQKARDVLNIKTCRKLKIPFVRRITGGGAILHNKEITYSIICSIDDLELSRRVKESYKALNSFLINFYKGFGLNASFACDIHKNIKPVPVDICFMGFEPFDIVIEGKKAGGNAQRRSKRIVFQHGSIPLEVDYAMMHSLFKDSKRPETNIFCFKNIINERKNYGFLQESLKYSFAAAFNVRFKNIPMTSAENDILKDLLYSKYYKETWNFNNEKSVLAQ